MKNTVDTQECRPPASVISRLGSEGGFSMLPALMAMVVGTLLSLGAWATANSDINFTDKDRWSRVAYQKAQSGVSDYVQHLAEDSGYWNKCDIPENGLVNNGLGQTAVNDTDIGSTGHPTRRWMPYAGAGTAEDREINTQYTIDLITNPGYSSCKGGGDPNSAMIDPNSGTFRVRVTGRAGPQAPTTATAAEVETYRQRHWKRVSLVVEFRRVGFLDYAYFTDHEGRDPALLTGTQRTTCDAYYQDDPGYNPSNPSANPDAKAGRFRDANCTELQFIDEDFIGGPVHTNDSIFVRSFTGASFGNANRSDRIEVYDNGASGADRCPFRNATHATPSYTSSSCKTQLTPGAFNLNAGTQPAMGSPARYLDLPEDNADLIAYADPASGDPAAQGFTFTGKTTIVLQSNGTFTVVNALVNGGNQTTYNYPTSGVIYVKNTDGAASCLSDPDAKYELSVPTGCAWLEVKGSYNKSLSIGSEADVVINGNLNRANSQTAVLGLIAKQYARVRHYGVYGYRTGSTNRCYSDSYQSGSTKVSQIRAAILTLRRSFTVDAYRCGGDLGDLRTDGGLAQRWRGAVGATHSSSPTQSGYAKNYNYDYTLKSQTPPHFLAPTAATWKIIRQRQTLPACACTSGGA